MKKRIFKLSAIVLSLAILLTSVTVTALAENASTVVYSAKGELKNPIYEDLDTGDISYSLAPKTYYSSSQDSDFDISNCTDDLNAVISNIRENMVNREATVNVYYKDNNTYDEQSLSALMSNWLELVVAETENANEGDYLRYVYSGCRYSLTTKYIIGQAGYYHYIIINFNYYTTKSDENQVDAKIDELIESFGFSSDSTDKQKSDVIYNYITRNVQYDHEHLSDENYKYKFTAYAALINGTAVCQGYATLFYRMARECGLSARVIAGTSHGENHAWNIVKIDSDYYYVDSTWDEGGATEYYLKGSDSFTEDHTPEPQFLTSEFSAEYPISDIDYDLPQFSGSREGDFIYQVEMDKAIITKYLGKEKDLVIPATIGGYPVSRLGREAIWYDDYIETLTFSEGITGMDMESVFGCNNLKEVNLPSTFVIEYEKYGIWPSADLIQYRIIVTPLKK